MMPVDKLTALPADYSVEFDHALMKAMDDIPSAEDRARRGDTVKVRRVNGQVEQVPLLDWHRQELERHQALRRDDPDWQATQLARFKAIIEDRISLYEEVEMFALRSQTTH